MKAKENLFIYGICWFGFTLMTAFINAHPEKYNQCLVIPYALFALISFVFFAIEVKQFTKNKQIK